MTVYLSKMAATMVGPNTITTRAAISNNTNKYIIFRSLLFISRTAPGFARSIDRHQG